MMATASTNAKAPCSLFRSKIAEYYKMLHLGSIYSILDQNKVPSKYSSFLFRLLIATNILFVSRRFVFSWGLLINIFLDNFKGWQYWIRMTIV